MKNGYANIVKYAGGGDVFAWRADDEYFAPNAKVSVRDNQEAVVVYDDRAAVCHGAGSHALFEGGDGKGKDRAAHCKVYFVDREAPMKLSWGTNAPIRMVDPVNGVSIAIRANGSYMVSVADSRRMVGKLAAALEYNDRDDVQDALSDVISSVISSGFADTIKSGRLDCRQLDACRGEIAGAVVGKLAAALESYGLRLDEFVINENLVDGLEKVSDVKDSGVISKIRISNDVDTEHIAAHGAAKTKKITAEGIAQEQEIITESQNRRDLQTASTQAEIERMKRSGSDYGYGQAAYPDVMSGDQSAKSDDSDGYSYGNYPDYP